jgi:sirohydrochlorin cobaltochelatase
VVPVFLGQGGHVLRDLPLMVEELRQQHPRCA